jgi:hypothetical protein
MPISSFLDNGDAETKYIQKTDIGGRQHFPTKKRSYYRAKYIFFNTWFNHQITRSTAGSSRKQHQSIKRMPI